MSRSVMTMSMTVFNILSKVIKRDALRTESWGVNSYEKNPRNDSYTSLSSMVENEGLRPLKPTNIVEPVKGRKMVLKNGTVRYSCWEMDCGGSKEERAKARSKTFPGIAKAMADQWGGDVCSHG